eukprot:2647792-Pleurochrysis_carterae.AAC.1
MEYRIAGGPDNGTREGLLQLITYVQILVISRALVARTCENAYHACSNLQPAVCCEIVDAKENMCSALVILVS